MHLDARLRFRLAVGVPTDMVPTVHDEDPHPEPLGALLGDRESEEPGAHDDQIRVHRASS